MNPVDELNLLLGIGPARPQLPVTLRKSGYVPVRALGKGSYGQALLVFHEPRQQYYVVKHLNLAGMTSRQRHDAHNEINILQKLHHPNIVQYFEYFEEHPHLYIVMEYADGGDVYSLLSSAQAARKAGARAYRGLGSTPAGAAAANERSGLLSEAQVVSLFVQTTMAVKYMHDRRLLHRDIKSSNIFLTKNHIVKLGDFGISTVLQNTMAMASTMCGTPCYFSPELCQGRPYNNKSDMWALGVLLYELCAGHVPFESTTMKTLMRDIVHKQPPRIPSLYSDELWELIVQLLQKDPRRRPDAGQVLMSGALMKYVPELIEQLASDPAYAAAAKENAQSSKGSNNYEVVGSVASHNNSAGAALPPRSDNNNDNDGKSSPSASPSPPLPRQRQEQILQHLLLPELNVAAAGAPASHFPSVRQGGKEERQRFSPARGNAADTPAAAPAYSPSSATAAAAATPSSRAGPCKAAPSSSSPPLQPPPKEQPSSSTASIAALLARFDKQKQQLAESKLKKYEQQQQPPQRRPQRQLSNGARQVREEGRDALPGLCDLKGNNHPYQPPQAPPQQLSNNEKNGKGDVAGGAAAAFLSPGAAAALRQQGLDAASDSRCSPMNGRPGHMPNGEGSALKSAEAAVARPAGPRRSFAPPPLPAALREPTAPKMRSAEPQQETGDSTPVSKDSRCCDGNSNNNSSSPRAEDNPMQNGIPSPAFNPNSAAAAAVGFAPTSSAELGAMLTELSTWRERSLRRQRRSHVDGESTSTKPETSNNNNNSKSSSGGEADAISKAPASSTPPPPLSPHPPTDGYKKEGRSCASTPSAAAGGITAGGVAHATHANQSTAAATPLSSRPSGAENSNAMEGTRTPLSHAPAATSTATAQHATSAPPPLERKEVLLPSVSTPEKSQQRQRQQQPPTAQAKEAGSPTSKPTSDRHKRPSLPSSSLPSPAASSHHGAGESAPMYERDNEGLEGSGSNALSFVDAMGTTLDVHALQEAAPAALPAREDRNGGEFGSNDESGGVAALSGTALRHGHQQIMHKSYRGTSEKIDALRATLKAGTLLTHAPADEEKNQQRASLKATGTVHNTPISSEANEAAAAAVADGEVGGEVADLRFTTACLCGRARTEGGCLSMIYGSFICMCDVCTRFTGAAQGVDWLHLPGIDSIDALLKCSTPQSLSPAHNTLPTSGSPSSTRELLRRAGIRSYTHQQALPSSDGERNREGLSKENSNVGAEEAERYIAYSCATCGGIMGMVHDDVPGLLLPKASMDEQSLQILSSCAQTVDLEWEEGEGGGGGVV